MGKSAPSFLESVQTSRRATEDNMGSHLSKYDDLPLSTASGGLEPLPTGGRWVRDGNTVLTLRAKRLSWSAADCTIYEGDETGGQVLFKISHNDLRDRAVFDANEVEIPTGYRRKMLSMLPVARIYWEVDGKVMIYATVKRIFGMRPSFGIHMHNPPVELDAMDDVTLGDPDFRVEASCAGHFLILQGREGEDEEQVKVATVRKDIWDLKENFPLHITVGPKMDLLFLCLVIGAVQEINAQSQHNH